MLRAGQGAACMTGWVAGLGMTQVLEVVVVGA
jgi:hypothetical protein